MTRFRLCGLLLAVLLAWAVDAWLKPVPKPRGCTNYAPEKAHPTWFTCPIAEQRWKEM